MSGPRRPLGRLTPATSPNDDLAAPTGGILFVAHRVPYPPDKGDRIRSYHLLAHLARHGPVDLIYPADEPMDNATAEALGRLCRRVEAVPIRRLDRWVRTAWSLLIGRSLTEGYFTSVRLRSMVTQWLKKIQYDTIFCFSSGALPNLSVDGLDNRLIIDLVDVDSQKWDDYSRRERGPRASIFRLEARRVAELERSAGRARVVSLATNREAELYRSICPAARVEVVQNGVDLDYYRPVGSFVDTNRLVFVGQLDYHANVISLSWFCRQVWPAIRAAIPTATFRIVGRNPTLTIRQLSEQAGIEVVGSVADVRPELTNARIVVVPLLVARGVQNKVLEAMAMGRAIVASPEALEGISLTLNRDAIAAATVEDWVRSITYLWTDEQGRKVIGEAARRFVECNHRWESTLSRIDPYIFRSIENRGDGDRLGSAGWPDGGDA